MSGDSFSPKDFGASFKGFLDQMAAQAPAEEPLFRRRLQEHFGADPAKLSIVTETFPGSEHQNVHLAVEAFVRDASRKFELLGIGSDTEAYTGVSLGQLVSPSRTSLMGAGAPSEGPVKYTNLPLPDDRVLACTQLGLYLIEEGPQRLALLVQGPREMSYHAEVRIEVLAAEQRDADRCLASIRTAMRRTNIYRGQVVSLTLDQRNSLQVNFHRLPRIEREQIILPEGLLERIERQTVGFARAAGKLLASGRHLKRGLLLHGPPGTGKTYSAMYLAGRMPDRTVLLITGRGMGLLEQACHMARLLQPATIILEDVDLIAEERTHRAPGCAPLLFELLNQMDGLADDADILFLLTTNRPELLEPALASRPGRVDQAIEVPVPDAACRRRLFDLYGRGLRMDADVNPYVERTAGASAAFIRELLRKAALFAADESDGQQLALRPSHLDIALRELVADGGALTHSLLGFRNAANSPTN